jgi:probable HAF family extracellular repeat protein
MAELWLWATINHSSLRNVVTGSLSLTCMGGPWSGGNFTQLDYPSACDTQVFGINDAGQMVGFADGHGFLLSNGFSSIMVQGSTSTRAFGINNFGDIVGDWTDVNGNRHAFIQKNGNITTFDFPNATSTTAYGINDDGDIVGSYVDTNGQSHGFITDPVALVDPVPDLLSGPAVISVAAGAQLLATKGTKVQGVAADGVTQVVVRIQADRVGDQFILTLINDQNGPINPDEDGALGNPGDTTLTQNHMTVTAVDTGSGPSGPNPPFAFAIYRAPKDFARPAPGGLYKTGTCAGVSDLDGQLKCRSVTLKVLTPLGNIINTPVTILRPPVALIHGLWSEPSDWDSFSPLFSNFAGPDNRFQVGLVNYSGPLPPGVFLASSVPDYSGLPGGRGLAVLANARPNSLGFQFNAVGVMSQIDQQIRSFKGGTNPLSTRVAAIQADIVAHSMGGDISRTLPLQNFNLFNFGPQDNFLSDRNFRQGTVHKLITIDTPHLGSPLATQLLQTSNSCVANILAAAGMPTFQSVQIPVGGRATGSVPGAVGDLADSPMSQALQNIANPGQHPLPTALIAGTVNGGNLAGLAGSGTALAIQAACSGPVASSLTPDAWPTMFNNQPNDAVVSLNSQLNGLSPDPGAVFDGDLHSAGIEELGFTGPTVLDSGPVPNHVIDLLNAFVSNSIFHLLNP